MKVCFHCQGQFEAVDWRCPHCHYEPPRLSGFTAFAPHLAEENESYSPEFFQTLADLIKHGVSFPFGGSLLLVARKS